MEVSALTSKVFSTQFSRLGDGLIWLKTVLVQQYDMPVLSSISCDFSTLEKKILFVAFANEDVTDKALKQYSLSERVFIVELSRVVFPVNVFHFEPDVSC